MKKIVFLLMAIVILITGCMASFPAKYDPKFTLDPQFGKQNKIYTNVKFENAFGKEVTEESLKLQLLTDKKFESWGFVKDKTGKNLNITVKNVVKPGSMTGGIFTGILCGLSLYIIPTIAVDHYQMTVLISEEGKEPAIRTYNGSITTYIEIAFIFWGLFAYPLKNAMYTEVDSMLDHLINDLRREGIVRHRPFSGELSGAESNEIKRGLLGRS